jgi:hypothetical protein
VIAAILMTTLHYLVVLGGATALVLAFVVIVICLKDKSPCI